MSEPARKPNIATLFLPVQSRAAALVAALLVFAYDVLTLAHDLSFYDSAELAMVSVQLGLSHPIGQPLYTLTSALFAHLPFVPPLLGLALFSALAHALCVVPLVAIAEALDRCESTPARGALRAGIIAALALAWPVWESATRVEVYALSSLLCCWTLARAMPLLRAAPRAKRDSTTRHALVVGVALGLLGATNAYLAVFTATALLPAIGAALWTRRMPPRAIAALLVGGVLGLLPYAYVPIVAGRTDVIVWGAPTDSAALLAYFRGADYARNRGIDATAFFEHLRAWLAWSVPAGVLPALLVGIGGHIALGRGRALGRSAVAILAASTIALLCSHTVFHVDITDYVDYLAPALLLSSSGSAALVMHVAASSARGPVLAGALALTLIGTALFAPPGIHARTRSRDHAARVMAAGALDEAPRNAVLVVSSDHWAAPMLYLQEVEQRRTDVVLVLYGLTSSRWYWEHLYRRHPALTRIALRAPGGRDRRVRRLLDAVPDRAVHVSDAELARTLGLVPCEVGYLVRVRPCVDTRRAAAPGVLALDSSPLEPAAATRALADAMNVVGTGSPATDGALAEVAVGRGATLWRLGHPAAALHALLAGVPPAQRPRGAQLDPRALAAAPPLRGELPSWREPAALGDPRRALFLAGALMCAAGAPDAARIYTAQAAALGLPEATPRD